MTQKRATRSTQYATAFILSIGTLAVYIYTLAPSLLRGDSGEFQWAMLTLNVPHAPGYPLYTMLGWLAMRLIPVGNLAYRANLMTAIFGALTVVIVYFIAFKLGNRRLSALAGALFLALAPAFWFYASVAEVYTLNALFIALILYLLIIWGEKVEEQGDAAPANTLLLVAFIYGLSLTNHSTMILLAPAFFVYLLLTDWRVLTDWQLLLKLAACGAAGLTPLLYLPLRMLPQGATWHEIIVETILARRYAGSLTLGAYTDWSKVLWGFAAHHLGWVVIIGGLLGMVALYWYRATRKIAVLLTLVWLGSITFYTRFWGQDNEAFMLPTFIVLCVGVGALGMFTAEPPSPFRRIDGLIVELILLVSALLALRRVDQVRALVTVLDGEITARTQQIMSYPFESNALVEAEWENATALRFWQAAEKVHPDLEIALLDLRAEHKFAALLTELDAGRPFYIPQVAGAQLTRFPTGYQLQRVDEMLLRIVKGRVTSHPLNAAVTPEMSLIGYALDDARLNLIWRATTAPPGDWATYVHYFDTNGRPLGQQNKGAYAEAVYVYPTSRWSTGIQDFYEPVPPDATYVRVGMYWYEDARVVNWGEQIIFPIRRPALQDIQERVDVTLGGRVTLLGYTLHRPHEEDEAADTSESAQRLDLYWRAERAMDTDYSVFVHFRAPDGFVFDQRDALAGGEIHPTSRWQPGKVVRTSYRFPASDRLSVIRVGMYFWQTEERLPRADASLDYVEIRP